MTQLHEIRLALVMNGGVSLAVWMGGVTHELDLIRRASTEGTPAPRSNDAPVASRWRELIQGSDVADQRRLVIDVIAGTSAGGLNGTLLATAIAYNSTLDPGTETDDGYSDGSAAHHVPWLRFQWCDLGTLRYRKLIPDPARVKSGSTGSVLDGRFFFDEAKRLLTELTGGSKPSTTHPVTLFTTASGLGRQEFEARDAAGQPFRVTDHRFLYRFSNTQPRRYDPATLGFVTAPDGDQDFGDIERLACAARASASFPVAFAPWNEDGLNNPVLRQRPRRDVTRASWLMDGGVLDNAPFGPVLAAVAAAPVSGHVSRYVMYVVPSAGIGAGTTAVDPASDEPPSWRQTAISAIQFPREVDFRSDVEELEALRVEADTAWSDTQLAFDAARASRDERERLLAAAAHVQSVYTRGRAAGGVWEALTVAQAGRITALDDSAAAPAQRVDQILGTTPRWTPPQAAPVVPLVNGTNGVPLWLWGLGPAERVVRTVLRSLRSQTATAFDAGSDMTSPLAPLEDQLAELTEISSNLMAIRGAVEREVAQLGHSQDNPNGDRRPARISPDSEPADVAAAINEVFDRLRVQEGIGLQVQRLIDGVPGGATLVELALAVEVVERCMSSRTPPQRSAPFKFVRLGPDIPLPVLSAVDQQRAERLGDRIIYGTQVGHFGSFGAEGWRRWDWLIGRLHAVAHLGRLLHDTTAPQGLAAADAWVADTQRAVLRSEGITEEDVSSTLEELENAFPPDRAGSGLREMLQAMNETDAHANVQPSTMHVGDRLVQAAGGLPAGLGRWVKAAAGRSELAQDEKHRGSAPDLILRWAMEPARTVVWGSLTAERASLERSKGWPTLAFNRFLWPAIGAVGIAALLILLLAGPDWKSLLAAIGTLLLLTGVAGTVIVLFVNGLRTRFATWLSGRIGGPHVDALGRTPERH